MGDRNSKSKGSCLFWSNSIDVVIQGFSFALCRFSYKGRAKKKRQFVGIYGWPEDSNKHQAWSHLWSLGDINHDL